MPDAPPAPVLETPELPGSRICCMFAKTGHGKTSVSRARAALWPRVLFVDSKARHTGVPEYWGMQARTARELQQLLKDNLPRPAWRIDYTGPVLVPVDPGKPDGPKTSEAFFRVMARIPNFLLVVEEAETYMSASTIPEGLYDIARQGRTIGQCLTVCAHRPADVARNLTAVADEIIAWPGNEPNDMGAIEARGFDLNILSTLGRHASMRLVQEEGERAEFFICRCTIPHAGRCGDALPRPPVKVSSGDTP